MFRHITKYCNFFIFGDRLRHVFKPLLLYVDLCNTDTPSTGYMQQPRLQNSPYFCVFKYARAVKQKVWNEAENRERDWGETLRACETRALRVHKALTPLVTDFFTDFEKKPTVLQSGSSLIVPLSVVGFCKFETTTYNMIYRFFLLVTYPA